MALPSRSSGRHLFCDKVVEEQIELDATPVFLWRAMRALRQRTSHQRCWSCDLVACSHRSVQSILVREALYMHST
jgi:hypothetical protein